MAERAHTYDTRAARAAAAVPQPRSPSPPPAVLPLFSLADVTACKNAPRRLQRLLRQHQLLLAPGAPCSTCEGTLHEHPDSNLTDGYRLQCSSCGRNVAIRQRSVFEHSQHTLFDLAQLITFFDARILVHQAEQLTVINRKRIGEFYTRSRERCRRSTSYTSKRCASRRQTKRRPPGLPSSA